MSTSQPQGHALPWHQRRRRRHAALRGVLTTAGCALGAAWLLKLAWVTWSGAAARPQPADAVQVIALGLAAVAAAWLAVLLGLATTAFLPGICGAWGRRIGAFVAPGPCLRLAVLLLSTGLATTATTGPAAATPVVVGAPVVVPTGTTTRGSLPGLPDPSFPSSTLPRQPEPDAGCLPRPGWQPSRAGVRRETTEVSLVSRCPSGDDPARLVVHRGDSLWQIAERHLGPGATPAEVARAWPRWFAANRDVIGDDPDLLLPGQVLTAPQEAS